jgi:hypothetical protein
MDRETVIPLLKKADYWTYDKISGLQLDGFYWDKVLEAFLWALKNDEDLLEEMSK